MLWGLKGKLRITRWSFSSNTYCKNNIPQGVLTHSHTHTHTHTLKQPQEKPSPEITTLHSLWQKKRNKRLLCSHHPWKRAEKVRQTWESQIALPGGHQHCVGRVVVTVSFDSCIWIVDNAAANVIHFWVITHHSRFVGAKKLNVIIINQQPTSSQL